MTLEEVNLVKTGNALIRIAFDNVAVDDRGLQSQENNRRRSGKKSRWELYCRTVRMGGVVVGGWGPARPPSRQLPQGGGFR